MMLISAMFGRCAAPPGESSILNAIFGGAPILAGRSQEIEEVSVKPSTLSTAQAASTAVTEVVVTDYGGSPPEPRGGRNRASEIPGATTARLAEP